MTVNNVALNGISEIWEPVIYAALAAVGWLLFRFFGPDEEVLEAAPAGQAPNLSHASPINPVATGEFLRN